MTFKENDDNNVIMIIVITIKIFIKFDFKEN